MLAALLFDLDGTLANTDPLHMRAWKQELAAHDLAIDEPFYRERISGRLNPQIVADLLPDLGDAEAEALIERKEARFRAIAERLAPLDGLAEVLAWARAHDLDVAVVTNAPRTNATFMLAALGLTHAFPNVVLGDEAPPGKPDPAPYRMALDRLGIDASAAIAFEDSVAGVTSASRAGIPVVGMTTTHPPAALRSAGASTTAADFRDEQIWRALREGVRDGAARRA